MTKEELEKLRSTVKEWLFYTGSLNPNNYADELCKDFIEPREKRIAELERNVAYYAERAKHAELNGRDIVLENKSLGERCLQLQKDKGNLTDRVRELEQQIEQAKKNKVVEHFEAYGQCRDSRRIAELEAQIEKMKKYGKLLQDICVVLGNDNFMVAVQLESVVKKLWDASEEKEGLKMVEDIENRLLKIKPQEWAEIDEWEIKEK